MSWRRANLVLLAVSAVVWVTATLLGLIGSTIFIGHVSMLALSLALYLAWRTDSPTEGES